MDRLPEIAELRTFLLAADEQSLSRAARRLHLSPAAVAKRLDNLEAVLGYPLLNRGPRGVSLTATGRAFHARAQRIVRSAEELLDREDAAAAERLSGVHRLLGYGTVKSTELLLADVERLLGHVLDSVSSGIVIHRASDGTIIEANGSYCTLAGAPREEIIGSTCPWYTDPKYESLLASFESGDAVRMSMLAPTPDGEGGAAELVVRRIDIAGESVLLVVVDDVTRTRKTGMASGATLNA